MSWVSPTGYDDPDGKWSYETFAYDGKITTKASSVITAASWGSFLELTHPGLVAKRLRVYVSSLGGDVDEVHAEVNTESGWLEVYEGVFLPLMWEEIYFGVKSISGARLAFHNAHEVSPAFVHLHELEFYEVVGRGLEVLAERGVKPRFLPRLDAIWRRDLEPVSPW